MIAPAKPAALEFFAGGGLARLGLSSHFDTIWANDIDPEKASAWTTNFGSDGFVLGDVHSLEVANIPNAQLAWASFPCQDLSLAGPRAGLSGERSGAFFGFLNAIQGLKEQRRAPRVLVIENVSGLLTSHNGQDFVALMQALSQLGYRAGALEIDARHFLPQSRPRVFIIACAGQTALSADFTSEGPNSSPFTSAAIIKAWQQLPHDLRVQHLWWNLPAPPFQAKSLSDVIDDTDQNWWPQAKLNSLIDSFSAKNHEKLAAVQRLGSLQIGAIYRRTRRIKGVSRAYGEARFDGVAGCLRTPSGGSSRQFLLFVEGGNVRARSLNAREAMRLMGVSDGYLLPDSARASLKIAGDGVAVPVVSWLSDHLLGPLVGILA